MSLTLPSLSPESRSEVVESVTAQLEVFQAEWEARIGANVEGDHIGHWSIDIQVSDLLVLLAIATSSNIDSN